MTREELIKLYQEEDSFWSVENLISWLVREKGVPQDIALLALEEAVQDVVSGRVDMPTHRFDKIEGCIGFDNYVLQIARRHMEATSRMMADYVEERLGKIVKERLGGNRFSKLWKVIKGEI